MQLRQTFPRKRIVKLFTSHGKPSVWRRYGDVLMPLSVANRTRPNERQDAREDVAELASAPRIDEPPSSPHRVPERLCRPDQVLCSRCFNIKYGAHLSDDLAARVGWQISK